MATNPVPEPVDPIDEEAERVFNDPEVQERIRVYLDRKARGELHERPHNEARRIVGLPPLPDQG